MPETAYTVRARIVVDPPKLNAIKAKLDGLSTHASDASGDVRAALVRAFAPIAAGGVVYAAMRSTDEQLRGLAAAIAPDVLEDSWMEGFAPILRGGAIYMALRSQSTVLRGIAGMIAPALVRGALLAGFAPILPGGVIAVAVAGLVAGVAAIGVGLATITAARMTRAVTTIGAETEDARTQLAVLLGQGLDLPINEAVEVAAGSYERLLAQAKALPGSLEDAVGAMRQFQLAALQAGATLGDVERLAGLAVAAGVASGVDPTSAGFQIRKAIEENATSGETPLVVRTLATAGVSAEKFNRMSRAGRTTTILAAFSRFEEAIDLASMGWTANWSALMDTLAQARSELIGPAFEILRDALSTVNEALDSGGLEDTARRLGPLFGLLFTPIRGLASVVATTWRYMSAAAPLWDLATKWLSELGHELTDLVSEIGTTLVPILSGGLAVAFAGLQSAVAALTFPFMVIARTARLVTLAGRALGLALAELVIWVADLLNISPFKRQADFGRVVDAITSGLGDIFRMEAQERADAREEDRKRRREKLQVEVKIDSRIEWADDRGIVIAVRDTVEQVLEQLARSPVESAVGLPRMA